MTTVTNSVIASSVHPVIASFRRSRPVPIRLPDSARCSTSSAVSQPPPWQKVSMQMTWPRSSISPVFLRRVADDGDLAVLVRRGQVKVQMLPEQQVVGLLVERHVGGVVGVDEKVRRQFRNTACSGG